MGRIKAGSGVTKDREGICQRDCGYVLAPGSKSGLGQPRFRLGRDEAQADHRSKGLTLAWDGVQRRWARVREDGCRINGLDEWLLSSRTRPVWDEVTMQVARAIARGEHTVTLPTPRIGTVRAGQWIDSGSSFGVPVFAAQMADAMAGKPGEVSAQAWASPHEVAQWLRDLRHDIPHIRIEVADEQLAAQAQAVEADRIAKAQAVLDQAMPTTQGTGSGQMLHQAMRAYSDLMPTLYPLRGVTPPCPTSFGAGQQRNLKTIMEHITDQPLDTLNIDALDAMIRYWKHRPMLKHKEGPMARLTCRDMIDTTKAFVKWLSRTNAFRWKKPEDWTGRAKVIELPEELAARMNSEHVDTFTVAELAMIYRAAEPWVRSCMVLALNCSFGIGELETLEEGEFKEDEDRIARARRKTKVYGRWSLWPESVQALEWLKAHKKRMRAKCPNIVVGPVEGEQLLPTGGTKRNANRTIHNHWKRTIEGIDGCRYLSFNHIRKTAADMVRQGSGGEACDMMLSHGKPASPEARHRDAYSNKPWAILDEATAKLREQLAPMFEQPKEAK